MPDRRAPDSGHGKTAPRLRAREIAAAKNPRVKRPAGMADRARDQRRTALFGRACDTGFEEAGEMPTGGSRAPHGARPVHGSAAVRQRGPRLAGGMRQLCVGRGQRFIDPDLGLTIYGITVLSPNGRFLYLWQGRSFSRELSESPFPEGVPGRSTHPEGRKKIFMGWAIIARQRGVRGLGRRAGAQAVGGARGRTGAAAGSHRACAHRARLGAGECRGAASAAPRGSCAALHRESFTSRGIRAPRRGCGTHTGAIRVADVTARSKERNKRGPKHAELRDRERGRGEPRTSAGRRAPGPRSWDVRRGVHAP
jgi:hypothetical protein